MAQKILLIEDDQQTANYIIKGLGEEGMTVDHAATGRDGLFHATDGGYDAIILDRMLPGMDGMAVLGAIRAGGIHTPVLMLSALAAVDDRVAGLTAGSDDYLTKPFAFAELLARLRLMLRRGSAACAADHPAGPAAISRWTCFHGKCGAARARSISSRANSGCSNICCATRTRSSRARCCSRACGTIISIPAPT